MVHLATIPADEEVSASLKLPETLTQNNFTTSVYGSKFAAQELPKHEIPEEEMPKDVAYRMIKDDLSLDGNPMLKYDRYHFPRMNSTGANVADLLALYI